MSESMILAVIVFGAMFAVAVFGLVKSNATASRLNATSAHRGVDRRDADHNRGLSGRP